MSSLLSPCHATTLGAALGDGVYYGMCKECFTPIIRLNPKTGEQEWLDNEPPWTNKELRKVVTKDTEKV